MTHDLIRQRLYAQAGIVQANTTVPPYKVLCRTEWSAEFERGMRQRLVMGAYRYGPLGRPGKPQYARMASIARRARLYAETGNVDLLYDIAALALCVFVEGDHPHRNCDSASEHDYHVEVF